jgi:hypothetical protein
MKSVLILFFSAIMLMSQTIEQRENKYMEYRESVAQKQANVDSLQEELNKLLDKIDREKSKSQPDQNILSEFLSDALEYSNSIDQNKDKITLLQENASSIAKELNVYYTSKLDSLSELIDNREKHRIEKSDLEQQFILYTFKRMQVSPGLPKLTFNPSMIETIDLDSSQTITEQNIYRDFLNRAKIELNQHYEQIDDLESSIRNIIRLEEKAMVFMEEVEDDALLPFSGQEFAANNAIPNENGTGSFFDSDKTLRSSAEYFAFESRIHSVILLNDQLSGLNDYSLKFKDVNNLTIEKRLELLKQTKESLKYYVKMVSDKLGD